MVLKNALRKGRHAGRATGIAYQGFDSQKPLF
jgi:hypothetical protein